MTGYPANRSPDLGSFIASGFSAVVAHRDPEADETDFFPTPPWGARACAELIKRIDPHARTAWEPACGAGHFVHGLKEYFGHVFASDAYPYDGNRLYDFLGDEPPPYQADWIVTNPPFAPAETFARLGYARARRGVALLCRIAFEEGQGRYHLHHGAMPLSLKAVFAERLPMAKGRYDPELSSASAYALFVWIKPCVRTPIARLARTVRTQQPDMALTMAIAPGAEDRLTRQSDAAFACRDASAARMEAADV